MERLLARYKADGANFLDGNPKELLSGLHYLGECGRPIYAWTCRPASSVRRSKRRRTCRISPPPFPEVGLDQAKNRGRAVDLGGRRGDQGVGRCRKSQRLSRASAQATLDASATFVPRTLANCRGRGSSGRERLVRRSDHPSKRSRTRLAGLPVALERENGAGVWPDSREAELPGYRAITPRSGEAGRQFRQISKVDAALQALHPDLWLPSQPVNGQNANLYDNDWKKILDGNRRMLLP